MMPSFPQAEPVRIQSPPAYQPVNHVKKYSRGEEPPKNGPGQAVIADNAQAVRLYYTAFSTLIGGAGWRFRRWRAIFHGWRHYPAQAHGSVHSQRRGRNYG